MKGEGVSGTSVDRQSTGSILDRAIALGPNLPLIPERLLLEHARGRVLFIVGAGVSQAASLPDFKDLVVQVYEVVDASTHTVLQFIVQNPNDDWVPKAKDLNDKQVAELRRFTSGDYDVVLGMLERRMEREVHAGTSIRRAICDILRRGTDPAHIHRAIMKLADRGPARTILTTNFDLLLEKCSPKARRPLTYSLGSIPRPSTRDDFAGIFHIHGALDEDYRRASEIIVSDQDFGEFYLRRRVVPDLIYDAARLYSLVLVGYSANDPPMRYLLNAVAADGSRFSDIKDRYTFVGQDYPDPVALEDWRARGIQPISYSSANRHEALRVTLERWAELSAVNGKSALLDAEVSRIVRKPFATSPSWERDLFEHFFRRGDARERAHLSQLTSRKGADLAWLDTMRRIMNEKPLGAA